MGAEAHVIWGALTCARSKQTHPFLEVPVTRPGLCNGMDNWAPDAVGNALIPSLSRSLLSTYLLCLPSPRTAVG